MDILKELEAYAAQNKVPIIGSEKGRFLSVITKIRSPKKILELGTAIGYSAIIMALNSEAKITSVERDKRMVSVAIGNIERAGLSGKIDVVEGDASDILPDMDQHFDFIFIDHSKKNYIKALPHCLRMLNDHGVIVADNASFENVRDYKEEVFKRDELESVLIPIGDELLLSVKRNITPE